ncbi:hypothetical protein BASA81_002371 [Batrachochytrium salamandrivorans]|nr:hypothetical protein BASA81_002371 [Batrachochytrium salamandrivorans]
MIPLAFPALRSVLWDQTSLGDGVLVGPSVCVPQTLQIRPQVLQSLFQRGNRTSLVIGRQIQHRSGAGVGGDYCLEFDSFDVSNGEALPKPTESSLSIRNARQRPFHIKSMQDPKLAIQCAVESWFGVKHRFRVTNIVKFYGFVSRPPDQPQAMRFTIEAYIPSVHFVFTRVPALLQPPPTPTPTTTTTAEAPSNDSLQYGLITLNETRKAVLLLEDDPLTYKLPVVGVWFKSPTAPSPGGSENLDLNLLLSLALQDPAIYAGCVRYAANEFLAERVSPPDCPRTMLVCLLDYAPTPLFAECNMSTLDEDRVLDLFTATVDSTDPASVIATTHFAHPTDIQDRLDFQTLVQQAIANNPFCTEWIRPGKPTVMTVVRELHHHDERFRTRFSLADFLAKQQEEIAEIDRVLGQLPSPSSPLQSLSPPPPPPRQQDPDSDDEAAIRAIEEKYLDD